MAANTSAPFHVNMYHLDEHTPLFWFDKTNQGSSYEKVQDLMIGMPCKCFGWGCRAVSFDFGEISKLISLKIRLCVRKLKSCDNNYLLQNVCFFFPAYRTEHETLLTSWDSTQNVNL